MRFLNRNKLYESFIAKIELISFLAPNLFTTSAKDIFQDPFSKIDWFENPHLKIDGFENPHHKIYGFGRTH